MHGAEQNERPDWYTPNKKAHKLALSATTSSTRIVFSRKGSIKEFALPAVSKQEKNRFQQHMVCINTALERHSSEWKMFT
jgi:hypothetical protein